MMVNKEKNLPRDMRQRGAILFHAIVLAGSSVISFWLATRILSGDRSISRDDDLLGGMWAVVATIFVCRYGYCESVTAALSRMAATLVSFALCLAYLLFLPFNVWGMAALIALGVLVITLVGRPDDTITTAITIVVVMVVAGIAPENGWRQPVLRLIDTAIGVAVGIGAAWISRESVSRQSPR